jgi:hypothetical protein
VTAIPSPDEDQFDPIDLVRRLHDQAVDFIVIGGVAARAHGSPSVTDEIEYDRAGGRSGTARAIA